MTRTPDMTTYHSIHTALRTGARALANASCDIDPADTRRVAAFARYWKGYAGEVLDHHTVEDTVFFPALVERVPAAGSLIERTALDHHRLDELMTHTSAAVDALVDDGVSSELHGVLSDLADLMDEHLDFEDAEILPLIARHFTADQYEALENKAIKQSGIGKQAAFTVPFVASMLAPEQREALFAAVPLPFRVLYRLTRRSHARLAAAALGSVAVDGPADVRPPARINDAA